VAWIDSDIVIQAAKAPNIFDGVHPAQIGAVKDYAFPTRGRYRARLKEFYRRWDQAGIEYVSNLTPQEFMTSWGLPPVDEVVQTGVIVASPEIHGPMFQKTYDRYEDKGAASWNYEMRPLSYEIVTGTQVKWLDPRFNVVTLFAVRDEDLDAFQPVPGVQDRILRRLRLDTLFGSSRRKARLAQIHRELFESSYFLHFAGRQSDMRFLQVPG
jgi:hypothetical protein